MSGGDPGQMPNQGDYFNQGPQQDGNHGVYNQAQVSGQDWYNQQQGGGGQPMFMNPADYPKTQPAVYNPYPGEPPTQQPAQGNNVITGGPPVPDSQQFNKSYQGPPEAQQGFYGQAQPFHDGGQYPDAQWNNAQMNNEQQWGQPLNGNNHVDPSQANPQIWNPAPAQAPGHQPFMYYGQDQNAGSLTGMHQPYENNNQLQQQQQQQQQAEQPSQSYGEYAYSDDNDSHKGFGSFYHNDDSDVLASSGTPSLSASERQTPDNILNPAVSDDPNNPVQPHSSLDQSQVGDQVQRDTHSPGQAYHGQPGGDPDQLATHQPPVPSADFFNQSSVYHQLFNHEQNNVSQVSNMFPDNNRTCGVNDLVPNDIQGEGHDAGQSEQPGIFPRPPESGFGGARNEAALFPDSSSVPSSEGGPPSVHVGSNSVGSSDVSSQIAEQPVPQVQGIPLAGEDQLSSHSQSSSVHGGSVSSHSLPPSASTSRSNSMLGEPPAGGYPSMSPVFRDPALGMESPRGSVGDQPLEQSGSQEAAFAQDNVSASKEPTNPIQSTETVASSDPSPQSFSVAPTYNVQNTQPGALAPSAEALESNLAPPQGLNQEMESPQIQNEPPSLPGQAATDTASGAYEMKLALNSHPQASNHEEQSQPQSTSETPLASLPPSGLPTQQVTQSQPTVPQGPKELSPTDEQTPATHPSAFRSVQRGNPPNMTSVNPSPPLWSAEVPPMPANILLAPAAPASANLVQPIRLSTPQEPAPVSLAASLAAVSVPSLPVEAVSLLAQPSVNPTQPTLGQPVATTLNSNPGQPSSSTQTPSCTAQVSQVSDVSQVTQNVSNLSLDPAQNPLLNQSIPPPPAQPSTLQTAPSAPLPQTPTESVKLAASAPALSVPTSSTTTAPPVSNSFQAPPFAPNTPSHIPQSQAPTGITGTPQAAPTPAQNPQAVPIQNQAPMAEPQHQQYQQQQHNEQQGQQLQQQQQQHPQSMQQQGQGYGPPRDQYGQHQQQPGQPPSNQWYDRRTSDPYYDRQYYDTRYQYDYRGRQYDYYAKQAAYDRQRGYGQKDYDANRSYSRQGYPNQERPRSRQGYPDRERPRSRQGYQDAQQKQSSYPEEENKQRPRSRQGKGYGTNSYNRGYDRKDTRDADYYKGYDAYGRPYDRQAREYWAKQGYYGNRSYDERYQEWERQSQYYRDRGQSERSQWHNTSAPEQQWANDSQAGRGDYQGREGDTRFASEFHHQGGHTPEKYSADQSSIHGQDYTDQNASSRTGYQDQYGYDYGYGADGSYQEVKQATPPPPERLTPAKFALPHLVARFSPGGHLIKVLPNMPQDGMPATVEIHSVQTMLEHTAESEELHSFPGPLVKGDTHKSDVISFAQRKSTACSNSTDLVDKQSAALLWDLMELLCRQNGNIMQADVSELLLKKHPMVSSSSSSAASTAPPEDEEEPAGEESIPKVQKPGVATQAKPRLRDVDSDTNKFRELLLFGRKKDALESAMKAGLWGHALLLACKMDSRTHTSVMTRFANSLPMNDPLQTLYQLMSNRQPAAVTCCVDEKWGDWRPHLAMILSNLNEDSELDMKSIYALGDSLASRGLLKASHFVYLMAQVGFGVYGKKTTKVVLLGSSHSLPFKSFALSECIQQTEVYEYCRLLASKHYALANYQPYKFVYATRLAEHGFTSQALSYCEVVANATLYMPDVYSSTLVSQICQLAKRLMYHDERYFDGQEVTIPEWLTKLEGILYQMNDGQIQPSSSSGTPMPWVESYSNLSTYGESVDSSGPTFDARSTDGNEPQTAVGDYTLTSSGYYQPATSTAGSANEPSAYSYDPQQQQQQLQLPGAEPSSTTQQMAGNYAMFGQQQQPLANLPQQLDPGASLNSNYSEYSTTSQTSAGESGTEFEESGASRETFDYYKASTQNVS